MDDDADAALEKFFEEVRVRDVCLALASFCLRGRSVGGPAGCSRCGSPSGGLQGAAAGSCLAAIGSKKKGSSCGSQARSSRSTSARAERQGGVFLAPPPVTVPPLYFQE